MTGRHFDVLIVGAGHAGAQTAIYLRSQKFAGSIAIVSDETQLPYERPPLSKDYLSGEKAFERILIRPKAFWEERNIALLTGHRVVHVDPASHEVSTDDGTTVGYGHLIWAAGGSPRRLSCTGHDLAGVHSIRTREDVDRLMAELPATRKVCVIGGGYIGLEAAAVLTKLGKSVTVLEAQDRVLARVAGVALSRFYEDEHRAHGVELHLNASVESIDEQSGRAAGVRLANGTTIACEMVIVGIGIIPAISPLVAAGAQAGNGLVVDKFCRTSLTDIYAIGDCAAHCSDFADGAALRVESVQNANDMAVVAARAIMSDPKPYDTVPWFWSNQYDLRLQTVGLSSGYDRAVIRGDISRRSFSVVYLKKGRVIALDCVNATRDYVAGRALVIAGTIAEPVELADPKVSLKNLTLSASLAAASNHAG